jgi:hypothetical protein
VTSDRLALRDELGACVDRGFDGGRLTLHTPWMSDLPPCGLYVTRAPVGEIPAGRLVYFHNHGDPGPGIYLPTRWVGNTARFEQPGTLLPRPEDAASLEAVPSEGFYRVAQTFTCCPKACRTFEPEQLVQLGYDGAGTAILFVPSVIDGAISVPLQGMRVDRDRLGHLALLRIPNASVRASAEDDRTLH